MGEEQEQKFHQLTEEPVSRVISHLAVPCIISMLVTAFYNMADTFFVGMLRSNAATGAVGVVFSMMAVIQAVGFFFGHGSGNFISRELGRRNTDSASNMAATGFFSALFTGLLICVFGEIFLTPLAAFLGSSPTILPYAKDYLRVILIGAPWMTASLVLNNQLRFQGNAIYGTIGIASGAVLNIGLDPLLIFVFDLGVAGAAWATIISQFAGFCLLLAGCTRGATLHIHISRVQLKWSYFKLIIQGGLPSLARQSLASVATICLNHAAMPYGDAAIAAMGVVQRITTFGASAMIGFGQGFQPVCGFNYGARLYHRVKEGFWFCVKVSAVFLTALAVVSFIGAPQIMRVFRKEDLDVIEIGTWAMRFQCLTLPLSAWIVMSNMLTQTIGYGFRASFVAAGRQGLFLIPALFVLPVRFGIRGLQWCQPVADALTFVLGAVIVLGILKELKGKAVEADKEPRNVA